MSNIRTYRPTIKFPDWETALGEISRTWFKENLDETDFFNRWRSELHRISGDMFAQHEIISRANRLHNLKVQKKAYGNNAERRREDAREHRRRVLGDPLALERRREMDRIRRRKREERDLLCKIRRRLRTRIFMALRGYRKAAGTVDLIGCSLDKARNHIQSLWLPEMTWENWSHRGWHLDHIIPCSSFDLKNPKEQKKCFHYSNLQPLWSNDNWKKSNKHG